MARGQVLIPVAAALLSQSATAAVPKQCSALPECAGLDGDCCPNRDGQDLDCCILAGVRIGVEEAEAKAKEVQKAAAAAEDEAAAAKKAAHAAEEKATEAEKSAKETAAANEK